MPGIANDFVDTIITDPPYGLGFMGKKWDERVPLKIWKECLRVAKPGAMMFVFGGTRTFHRLTCAIEDAGWQIRDCMMWLYGSGFPKSHDISRQYQIKRHGWKGKCISNFIMGSEYIEERRWWWRLEKKWDGYNTALKPAWEPIIVAMKPLDGTFAANAEKWGVAGLWINGGRIGKAADDRTEYGVNGIERKNNNNVYGKQSGTIQFDGTQGRWPANLILDEEAAELLDEQSGNLGKSQGGRAGHTAAYQGGYKREYYGDMKPGFGDSGGASRFFYCAKASRSERNEGLEGMEAKMPDGGPDRTGGKGTGYKERLGGSGKPINGTGIPRTTKNNHPTVKPLKLIEYLCKLTRTPEGGILLDPFGGSGTTAIACVNTGRKYLLIEKDPHYCEIARARISTFES